MKMMDSSNALARSFRRIRDYVNQGLGDFVGLRLFRNNASDPRTYNLPILDEVAALIVGDFDSSDSGREIILRSQSGVLRRIPEKHTSFLPLQYPLLFPCGKHGYADNI